VPARRGACRLDEARAAAADDQWGRPFMMDSTLTAETFGLKPEPINDALHRVAQHLRG
jgi:hypothetical protein